MATPPDKKSKTPLNRLKHLGFCRVAQDVASSNYQDIKLIDKPIKHQLSYLLWHLLIVSSNRKTKKLTFNLNRVFINEK